MTNADKRLGQRLTAVFGKAVEGMTVEELRAAGRVVMWYEGQYEGSSEVRKEDLADVIWYALEEEFGRDVALGAASPARDAKYIDARMAMFKLVQEKVPYLPKSHIAEFLGLKKDHATVLNALKKADDLLIYDEAFRRYYSRLVVAVNAKLEEIVKQRDLEGAEGGD